MKKLIPIMCVVFLVSVIALAMGGCENQGDSGNNFQDRLPAKCMTKTEAEYDSAIRDRFQTGFNNWNQGYEAWLKWCDELYDQNAYYNVYGHRMTLDQYKRMMGAMFEQYEIMLGGLGDDAGAIQNVLVDPKKGVGSIQYVVSFKKKAEEEWVTLNTMEFVQFRPDEDFGARVVEGWAISDSQITPDQEVIAFWMNPANDWDVLMARAANWK